MGQQVIKQPDGKLCVFDSVTDTIIVWDGTRDEIVRWFVDRAVARATREATEVLDHVEAGTQRQVYYQFAMTWDEALAKDRERGGDAWRYFT